MSFEEWWKKNKKYIVEDFYSTPGYGALRLWFSMAYKLGENNAKEEVRDYEI